MALSYVNEHGTLNGTTEVTLVAAPGANITRLVSEIRIANVDTAAVTVTVSLADGATRRRYVKATLEVDEELDVIPERALVLDTTSKSIVAVMEATPATTNPDFVSQMVEVT